MGAFDGVIRIPGLVDSPVRIISLAAGALLVVGYLMALFNWYTERAKAAEERRQRESLAMPEPALAGGAPGTVSKAVTGGSASQKGDAS
jgi:hypothetical protein